MLYLTFIYLLFFLFASKITQKVADEFGLNSQSRLNLVQLKDDLTSMVIRIGIWTQEETFGFYNIARYKAKRR